MAASRFPEAFSMRFRSSAAAAALLTWAASALVAQQTSPRDAMLVSTSWLAQHLKDPNVVILHVGDPKKYEAAHIPGAQLMQMMDLSVSDMSEMKGMPGMEMPKPPLDGPKNGLSLEMPTPAQLRSQLEKFGISDNTKIVVYEANLWLSPSTRTVFALDYAGLGKNTVVLDGGLAAWTRENREITNVVPTVKPGTLPALTLKPIVATAEFVRDHVGKRGYAVIDARSGNFYDGVPQSRGEPKRYGHIAGAKNLPFDSMHDQETGALKPASELAALFAKAGVQPGDTVIAYCHIGQQATAVLFAARSLGHPVMLYDGSWNDWDKRDASFPVENPSAKTP
jgi:thiosulfate/3-mercaptopyruvate sulfurtransferase